MGGRGRDRSLWGAVQGWLSGGQGERGVLTGLTPAGTQTVGHARSALPGSGGGREGSQQGPSVASCPRPFPPPSTLCPEGGPPAGLCSLLGPSALGSHVSGGWDGQPLPRTIQGLHVHHPHTNPIHVTYIHTTPGTYTMYTLIRTACICYIHTLTCHTTYPHHAHTNTQCAEDKSDFSVWRW